MNGIPLIRSLNGSSHSLPFTLYIASPVASQMDAQLGSTKDIQTSAWMCEILTARDTYCGQRKRHADDDLAIAETKSANQVHNVAPSPDYDPSWFEHHQHNMDGFAQCYEAAEQLEEMMDNLKSAKEVHGDYDEVVKCFEAAKRLAEKMRKWRGPATKRR